jgi:hypothetical protein
MYNKNLSLSIKLGFARSPIKGKIEATPNTSIKADIKIKNNNSIALLFSNGVNKSRIFLKVFI